jgi:hypothetical protein
MRPVRGQCWTAGYLSDSVILSRMQEGRMAHRSIGQERLGFAVKSESASSLNDLSRLIDWDKVAVILGQVHASARAYNGKCESASTTVTLTCFRVHATFSSLVGGEAWMLKRVQHDGDANFQRDGLICPLTQSPEKSPHQRENSPR